MKRVLTMVGIVAMSFTFAACSGSKKDAQQTENATEQMDEATDENAGDNAIAESVDLKVAAEEALKKYEQAVKDYLDVLVKFQKGDMSVASKYQKLSQELPQVTRDAQQYAAEFDAKQTKRLEATTKKYTDATNALAK